MAIRLHGESNLAPEVELLKAQRIHDTQPGARRAEHVRLIYRAVEWAAETQASISWEALAQLRTEMARADRPIGDSEVLHLVLVPWALDQVALALQSGASVDSSYVLDFGDAPRPAGVREILIRFGLLEDD